MIEDNINQRIKHFMEELPMNESPELIATTAVDNSTQEQGGLDINKALEVGYVVGVASNGELFFEVVGNKPNLAGLLGAHDIAARRIEELYDSKMTQGNPLLKQVAQALVLLGQKVDKLSQDSKPANLL